MEADQVAKDELDALLQGMDMDASVYGDFIIGILNNAAADAPPAEALEEVRQLISDANPATASAALDAFVASLSRLWLALVNRISASAALESQQRAAEADLALLRLSATSAAPTVSSATALSKAPRLSEEEKRAILAGLSERPEAANDDDDDDDAASGASANRARVQQQRKEDLVYRAEHENRKKAESKAAEKAGKQAREAKKEARTNRVKS